MRHISKKKQCQIIPKVTLALIVAFEPCISRPPVATGVGHFPPYLLWPLCRWPTGGRPFSAHFGLSFVATLQVATGGRPFSAHFGLSFVATLQVATGGRPREYWSELVRQVR
jgi:hypothetical protein